MLRGEAIANDGYVDADQIGYDGTALMCHTNKTDCCGHPHDRAGHWYYPNGTQVDSYTNNILKASDFYSRDRRNSVVRLRTVGHPPERGRFYCEVPDANGRNQTVYVNISMSKSSLQQLLLISTCSITLVDIIGPVIISPSGKTVGTNFTLNCSVTITQPMQLPPPYFEWFFGENNTTVSALDVTVSNVTDSGNTYNSILQFSILSPAGLYTCRVGGNKRLAASVTINVNCEGHE